MLQLQRPREWRQPSQTMRWSHSRCSLARLRLPSQDLPMPVRLAQTYAAHSSTLPLCVAALSHCQGRCFRWSDDCATDMAGISSAVAARRPGLAVPSPGIETLPCACSRMLPPASTKRRWEYPSQMPQQLPKHRMLQAQLLVPLVGCLQHLQVHYACRF